MNKDHKNWKSTLINRVDKKEWSFPTLAFGRFSGVVVYMTGTDPETGEGIGHVMVKGGDQKEGIVKRTWILSAFTPIDGEIVKVECEKKDKAKK